MASRRHFRYIVRDQYGFVIQNARVSFFQPGTSTDFTGTAFDAFTGGSAVTNPFVTNAQGEVEAYFTTAQDVDIFVDDNNDTAYRAVNGSGAVISFTSFTERGEILEDTADLPNEVGGSGDLATIDAGDSAVAGTTGKWADAGHQHAYTTLPNAHGAATHTNITRDIWLDPEEATLDGASLATLGTTPNIIRTVQFDDAVTTDKAHWAIMIPSDWDSGAISAQIYMVGATTTSGSVRWTLQHKMIANGGDVTAAGTATTYTSAALATANLLVKDTLTAISTPAAAGDVLLLNVQRVGTDGADTYAAVCHVIGIRLTYTANQ